MLKQLRSKAVTKFVLWALLILILPAFVLWGTGNLGGGKDKKGPVYVGTIENKKISFDDFATSITSVRCQIILNYFNNQKSLESLMNNKAFIGKLAWDRLIMLAKARAAKIRIGDSDVIKFITSHPLFIRNGKFDDRVYEYFLKNSLGLYPRSFEEIMRENIMIQKLTDAITKDVNISDAEVLKNYERDNSKFKISYLLIPVADFTGKVKVNEDEIKKFYEEHKKEFMVQTNAADAKKVEKKMASYDEMKETIKTFLSENKARPLVQESANKTYDELNKLMTKNKLSFEAAAAKLKLKTQESVSFVKSEYLEGIGAADWITAAAIKMKKDEISKPADVRKGMLIFKVAEAQPFDQEKFKKEREDYTKQELGNKKNSFVEDWINEREKGAKLNIDLKDYDKYYK